MKPMKNIKLKLEARLDPYLYLVLCLGLWLVLYGAPGELIKAGYADAVHVLFEGAAALALLLATRDKAAAEASRPSGRRPRYALLALAVIPLTLLLYASTQMLCLANSIPYVGDPEDQMGKGMYVWYALRTCATAPLMEELGCRRIVFGGLRRLDIGFWPAALASAALFGCIHVGIDPYLAIATVAHTLLQCLVYEATGKLRYCVAGHAAYNLLALPDREVSTRWPHTLLFGVPRSVSIPFLAAVSAVVILLCLFRKKLFLRDGQDKE